MKAFALQIDELLRRVDLERQVRMPFMPASHPRQQPALRERRQHRHAQPVRGPACGRRCGLHSVLELRERRLHAAQQDLTRRIQHDAASAALEQIEAELFLEHANLLADRAVRQMQRVGRGAQIEPLGDGTKRGQRVERKAGHRLSVGVRVGVGLEPNSVILLVSTSYQNVENKLIPLPVLGAYPYQRHQPIWSST